MNLFFLATCAREAARHHCDKHVGKLLLEAVQLLHTAHWILTGAAAPNCPKGLEPFKSTHHQHPMARWVRTCAENYNWTADLALGLAEEFNERYSHPHMGAPHAVWLKSCGYPANVTIDDAPVKTSKITVFAHKDVPPGCTPVPLCMPTDIDPSLRVDSVVEAYRGYYCNHKTHFAKWRHSPQPAWYIPSATPFLPPPKKEKPKKEGAAKGAAKEKPKTATNAKNTGKSTLPKPKAAVTKTRPSPAAVKAVPKSVVGKEKAAATPKKEAPAATATPKAQQKKGRKAASVPATATVSTTTTTTAATNASTTPTAKTVKRKAAATTGGNAKKVRKDTVATAPGMRTRSMDPS